MQFVLPGRVRRKEREETGKEEVVGVFEEFITFNWVCVGMLGR